jgi:hypothetical protein
MSIKAVSDFLNGYRGIISTLISFGLKAWVIKHKWDQSLLTDVVVSQVTDMAILGISVVFDGLAILFRMLASKPGPLAPKEAVVAQAVITLQNNTL